MNYDDIIEQAARVLARMEPGEDWPTNEFLGGGMTGTRDEEFRQEMIDQARDLDAAGLLARPLPSRERIAMQIAARHWDRDSGDVEAWHDLTPGEREAVAENYLTWDSADAVLALLEGAQE